MSSIIESINHSNSHGQVLVVAYCPTSSLMAVYNPLMTHANTRITVQCYDRNTLLSTPKFSLSVPILESAAAAAAASDGMTSSKKETLTDLVFASFSHRLIGCITAVNSIMEEEHSLVVWDVSRGVPIQPRIILPSPYQILHVATTDVSSPMMASSGGDLETHTTNDNLIQDKLFVLGYHSTQLKLVVFVYHVGIETSWKLIQKIKVGITLNKSELLFGTMALSSSIPYRSCVLAVCTTYQAMVVRVPYLNHKKMKMLHIETGHVMGKCKIPSLSSSSSSLTTSKSVTLATTSETLVFSKDGTLLALFTPNTSMGGNIFIWDVSTIYNRTFNEKIHESDYEEDEEEEEDDGGDDKNDNPQKKNKKKKKDHHHSHASCIGIFAAPYGGSSSLINNTSNQVTMEVVQINSNTLSSGSSSLAAIDPTILILFTNAKKKQTCLYTLTHKQKDSSSPTIINHVMSWTCDFKDTKKGIVSASLGPTLGQIVIVQAPIHDDESKTKDFRFVSSISLSLVSFLKTQLLEKGDLSLSIQSGDIILTSSPSNDKKTEILKKRKANAMAGQTVIGPGESGSEALKVSDVISTSTFAGLDKKQKALHEEEDFFKVSLEEQDEIGDDGQTVERRLANLNAQLYEEDGISDEEQEDEDDIQDRPTDIASGKQDSLSTTRFSIKAATSGSLETLLRQALASNDDSQLEIALQVVDKKVIENSILGLAVNDVNASNMGDMGTEESINKSSELVLTLLSKLVTRLARKPTRAEALVYWIRTILFVLVSSRNDGEGGVIRMGEMERQVASKLGPLRNLLSERVECLPALLKLEGRLELLTQHRSI